VAIHDSSLVVVNSSAESANTSRWRSPSNLWHAFIIAGVLFVSYGYFYQGAGYNQNSRFDQTRAIVELHTLRIDAYQANTGDKSLIGGHFYSDKAPGLTLAAVPVWAASRIAVHVIRRGSSKPEPLIDERYVATVVTVGLPSALAAACLFLLALDLGASVDGAGFAAIALGLATPFWCYATLFWGHAPSAAYLLFAFAAAMALRKSHSPGWDLGLASCVGLLAGWAVVTDFTAAPPAAILTVLALAHVWPDGRRRVFRVATGIAAGALPCVFVLMIYNALAFGSPIRIAYPSNVMVARLPWQRQGFMGVTYPKLNVLRQILVGRYRGLLPLAPVIAAAPLGLWLLWKRRTMRWDTLALTAIALYYVLLNASYSVWDGGWSYGPRLLSPALPFLCLPLALAWSRSGSMLRSLLAALGLWGVALSLMAVSTYSMPPDSIKAPVSQLLWPAFRAGHLSPPPHTWNLGIRAGLPGLVSLIPLLLVWVVALVGWRWLERGKARLSVPAV
jgi:hypothetical protein